MANDKAMPSSAAPCPQELPAIREEIALALRREGIVIPETCWDGVVAEYETLRSHIALVNRLCPAQDSPDPALAAPVPPRSR